MAGSLMAQPAYPQLRKYPCVPALALRAMKRRGLNLFGTCRRRTTVGPEVKLAKVAREHRSTPATPLCETTCGGHVYFFTPQSHARSQLTAGDTIQPATDSSASKHRVVVFSGSKNGRPGHSYQ